MGAISVIVAAAVLAVCAFALFYTELFFYGFLILLLTGLVSLFFKTKNNL